MIPRTLVPVDISPAPPQNDGANSRRHSTTLDSRQLIPRDLPVLPIVGGSAIPSHVPLDVLGERTVVPRDLPPKALRPEDVVPSYPPLSILDARVVVPAGLPASKLETVAPVRVRRFQEMLEPDVIMAGEVNLLPVPVGERRPRSWIDILLLGCAGLVAYNVIGVLLLELTLILFPARRPTQDELELARRQLSFIYLPPGPLSVPPKETPRAQEPSNKIRVDPRILRQVAPPNVEPSPLPGPLREQVSPKPAPELPSAPRPRVPIEAAPEQAQQPTKPRERPSIEPLQTEKAPGPLVQPQLSPGKALEQSLRGAMQGHGGSAPGFSDPIPRSPGAEGGGGGGGGQGNLGGNLEILTPLEGVDFTNYFARLLASVRRNWYAVIPESARLGDRGRVVIQFRIMRDGSVPFPEPRLVGTSGKEPLDRAAMSSIHASKPFEQLPPAFTGPYIELRFTFLYNLPLDYR